MKKNEWIFQARINYINMTTFAYTEQLSKYVIDI